MPHTQSQFWIHLLWSTRAQIPFLTLDIQAALLDHLRETSRAHDLGLDTINIVQDHVHCICRVLPRFAVADIVDRLKGTSAHWINAEQLTPLHFSWEPAYIGCSVGPDDLIDHRRIVHDQESIHQTVPVIEEARALLAGTLPAILTGDLVRS